MSRRWENTLYSLHVQVATSRPWIQVLFALESPGKKVNVRVRLEVILKEEREIDINYNYTGCAMGVVNRLFPR